MKTSGKYFGLAVGL